MDHFSGGGSVAVALGALASDLIPLPTAAQGEALSRGEVRALQQKLNALGYDAGPADGAWGRRTQAAAEAFRRDQELPEDTPVREVLDRALAEPGVASGSSAEQPDGKTTSPQMLYLVCRGELDNILDDQDPKPGFGESILIDLSRPAIIETDGKPTRQVEIERIDESAILFTHIIRSDPRIPLRISYEINRMNGKMRTWITTREGLQFTFAGLCEKQPIPTKKQKF